MANKNTGKQPIPGWIKSLEIMSTIRIASIAVIVIAVTALVIFLTRACKGGKAEVTVDNRIDATPTVILSMKEIGEWEFLSVADEELIDTVRKGFFKDDELIRIYHGTLHLGIDMHKIDKSMIKASDDSITLMLPPIQLLDEDFIDEARTQSFFESGKWTDKDRADMYRRAYLQMKKRCITNDNIRNAKANAKVQLTKMMRAFGYKNVDIRF